MKGENSVVITSKDNCPNISYSQIKRLSNKTSMQKQDDSLFFMLPAYANQSNFKSHLLI